MHDYKLSPGSHGTREAGMCALEWIAFIAGEEHTWRPACVAMEVQEVAWRINDFLDVWHPEKLQSLRPYLARCIGTNGDGQAEFRRILLSKELNVPLHGTFSPDGYLELPAARALNALIEHEPDKAIALLDAMLPLVPVRVPVLVDEAKALTEAVA